MKSFEAKSFEAMGDGLTFLTEPLDKETEITGPSALKLFVSSSTKDADLFVVLRVFTGDLKEVVFQGAIDPHTPIGQGWLRASHRKLDKKLSTPYRPYHTHDQKQPLKKGAGGRARHRDLADLDRGARRAIASGSPSAARTTSMAARAAASCRTSRTSSPAAARSCTTTRATGRRTSSAGTTSLHFGGTRQPYLLLPIIPPEKAKAPKRGRGRK